MLSCRADENRSRPAAALDRSSGATGGGAAASALISCAFLSGRVCMSRGSWLAVAALTAFAVGPSLSASAAVTIQAPTNATAGTQVTVVVTGSGNTRDFVTIVPTGSAEGRYEEYRYLDTTPLTLPVPPTAGAYEVRVLGADWPYPTLAKRTLDVRAASATLDAPAQVAAGREIEVRWTGPANPKDYVALGDAAHPYLVYGYVRDGNPVRLPAPEAPGAYELRYFLGEGDAVVARRPLTVTAVSGSVAGPAQAVAGSTIAVSWTGPNNARDYLTIVPAGAREGESGEFAYTASGSPARIVVPLEPGNYEIRYSLAQSQTTLARAALRVTPSALAPGQVQVTAATRDAPVLVIVDASGSMLQKLGGERRIDIARRTLTVLATRELRPGTPFALRAFGREAGSCRTDLVLPLAPLDPAVAAKTIDALVAKSEARTPIGASLDAAAQDLAGARGAATIILVTDGEETCGGDPAGAIERLQRGPSKPVVNIVGFAVDEARVAATFRQWASLGRGAYFDARDAGALQRALADAAQPRFELVDAKGAVVASGRAGGEPVTVLPGEYQVRLRGAAAAARPVQVRSGETAAVAF
jgi:Mg-chelatase subunit ChlD